MRVAVDEYLDQKEPFAFIARVMTARGFKVSADVVSKHSRHRHEYAPPPTAAPNTERRDIAKLLQQRMGDAIATMPDDELFDKDNQSAIGNALKAQNIIDKREIAQKKQTGADVLLSLLAALRGEGRPAPQLEDGMTIEGEAVEVD